MHPAANGDEAVGRSAMRKAFWRILPLILVAYLFAYVDRVNVAFAAAEMNRDLAFSATVYGLGGGLFFLGYALFEIPSNLMLVRVGARRWIARIMITWGALSAAMMFVQTDWQFYLVRFLLGAAEAGFYPGVITYFASWFPPCHRSRAVSRFFIATPLGTVLMGLVSGWLLALDGLAGLQGWQWLFLAQGLPTVLFGFVVLALLPERPQDVRWLDPREKAWIESRLAAEQARIGPPERHHLLAAMRHPNVLLFGVMGMLLIGAITTFILSAPQVLAATTGLDTFGVGALVSLGGLLGAGAIILLGNHADRHGDRLFLAFGCALGLAAAFALLLGANTPLVAGAAYLLFACVCFAIPMLTSSCWAEVLSLRELAVGSAAINTLSQIGAFLGPIGWGALKDRTGSFDAGLGLVLVLALGCAGMILLIHRRVRGSARQRLPATA